MGHDPRQQFADLMARVMSSAVRTAIEYDDNNDMLKPAVEYIQKALNTSAHIAYNLDPLDEDMAVYIAPYDINEIDPMFETDAVMLSDIIASEAGRAEDENAFWVALEAAITLAKKKVVR